MADQQTPGWKQVAEATLTPSLTDAESLPVNKPCSGGCQKDLAQIMAGQETLAMMMQQLRDRVDVLKDAVNQVGELSNVHANKLEEIVTMAKNAFAQFSKSNPLSFLLGGRRG
jgi:hypothetical protein